MVLEHKSDFRYINVTIGRLCWELSVVRATIPQDFWEIACISSSISTNEHMEFSSNRGRVKALGQIKRPIRFTMSSYAIGKRLLLIPENRYEPTIKKYLTHESSRLNKSQKCQLNGNYFKIVWTAAICWKTRTIQVRSVIHSNGPLSNAIGPTVAVYRFGFTAERALVVFAKHSSLIAMPSRIPFEKR